MLIRTFSPKHFSRLVSFLLMLVIAPTSLAEVYKCVHEVTGRVSFSDKDCPNKTAGKSISVGNTNSDFVYEKSAEEKLREKHERQEAEYQKAWRERNEQAAREANLREAQRLRKQRQSEELLENSTSP